MGRLCFVLMLPVLLSAGMVFRWSPTFILRDNSNVIITGKRSMPVECIDMNIVPNPLNSAATIKIKGIGQADFTVTVFDIKGKKVEELSSRMKIAGSSYHWRPANLGSGIYLICLRSSKSTKVAKAIILK
jgi:hypothetical protein